MVQNAHLYYKIEILVERKSVKFNKIVIPEV